MLLILFDSEFTSAPTEEPFVGGIDDGVDAQLGDVALEDGDFVGQIQLIGLHFIFSGQDVGAPA